MIANPSDRFTDSKGFLWLANDKNYHMILVSLSMKEMKPCCNVRWAVAGDVAARIADCRADVCGFITGSGRIVILMGLVLTSVMLYHKQYGITFCYHRAWRLLLPSC